MLIFMPLAQNLLYLSSSTNVSHFPVVTHDITTITGLFMKKTYSEQKHFQNKMCFMTQKQK